MSKVTELSEHVKTLPTIMEIEDEIALIEGLMQLSLDEISAEKEAFCAILEALLLSHLDDGIYELTKENEGIFAKFSAWLAEIKSLGDLDLDDGTVQSFGTTYADIFGEEQHEAKAERSQRQAASALDADTLDSYVTRYISAFRRGDDLDDSIDHEVHFALRPALSELNAIFEEQGILPDAYPIDAIRADKLRRFLSASLDLEKYDYFLESYMEVDMWKKIYGRNE